MSCLILESLAGPSLETRTADAGMDEIRDDSDGSHLGINDCTQVDGVTTAKVQWFENQFVV